MEPSIHLSVVATSRNDNHGKNLLYRMRHFAKGFIKQCKKHDLCAELILVDWNPPDGAKPLLEALELPKDRGPCQVRVIQVPNHLHATLNHADKIPLFQMIGKNVGIRRARGEFVLATNIDILFSNELMAFLKKPLDPEALYRVDRLDVPEILPETDRFDEILSFCKKNYFRINKKTGTVRKGGFSKNIQQQIRKFGSLTLFDLPKLPAKILKKMICNLYPETSLFLHTNACGDFTLLSRKNWEKLKGYPEWNYYSWHLDSVLLHQAKHHEIREIDLPCKMAIYHIEHEVGSGYSPERASALFDRLNAKGIPYLSDEALNFLIKTMHLSKNKLVFNKDDWGFGDLELKEYSPL